MFNILISPARPTVLRIGAVRLLAVAVAAGGATLALSGDDPAAPAQKTAPPSAPMQFGDPAVVKGARGGATTRVRLQDPARRQCSATRPCARARAAGDGATRHLDSEAMGTAATSTSAAFGSAGRPSSRRRRPAGRVAKHVC